MQARTGGSGANNDGRSESPARQAPRLQRARLEPIDRLAVMAVVGGMAGAVCGGVLGGRQAGRAYLASRAHRLPTTVAGWFFYHKWKNYRVVLGAMRGAAVYAARLGACALAFAAIEAAADRAAGEAQAASSALAGLATATGVSLLARLPRSSARRARHAGLAVGLAVGALQDAAHVAAGRPPAYVACINRTINNK
ncbi:hypothetical protein EV174_005228 [Coemansia sp. RSA 2320]|nr:hypothetical protein EV174_005228 [Coemansia sp. RSA 2320]